MQFFYICALAVSGGVAFFVYHGHFEDADRQRRLWTCLRAGSLSALALYAVGYTLSGFAYDADQQAQHATALAAHRQTVLGFVGASGRLNPISNSELVAPREPSSSGANVWLVVAIATGGWLLYRHTGTMINGWYWVRTVHPATGAVAPNWDEPINAAALGAALRSDPSEIEDPPPAYQSEALKRKADALKSKLDADAAIANAAVERERARKRKERAA
jgi:hypothetical protein